MKALSCKKHGRRFLANAGVPNAVRCTVCCEHVFTYCRKCQGDGCPDCGWSGHEVVRK